MDDYKKITKSAYEEVADGYIRRDKQILDETSEVLDALDSFSASMPAHGRILDVGSGGGRDSRTFFKKGFQVTGIDFARNMIEQAKEIESGIDYRVMDIETLDFPESSFDGIWANASLHHMPRVNLTKVLKKISEILKPGGLLFVIVKNGAGEGFREDEKFGVKVNRYFAYYSPEEMSSRVRSVGLRVLESKIAVKREWVYLLAQKES